MKLHDKGVYLVNGQLCDTAPVPPAEARKAINDYIIAGNQGFDHWFLKQNKAWFDTFDIMDDMQKGLSLKAIE